MAHKFYLTNNLGGGGTNVSRFVDYKELFDFPNIGLLLNYYYLTGQSRPKFDSKIIKEVKNYDNISDFLNGAKQMFAKIRSVSKYFKQNLNPTDINGYMLDNGCGNILRDFLQKGEYTIDSIRNIVVPFLEFAEMMQFDFSIALDYAMKYTYKDGENGDIQMRKLWEELAGNEKINLSLIEATLYAIKAHNYQQKIYAPLHGFNYKSFENYLESVLKAEVQTGASFGGFALGGIADNRRLSNTVWDVPPGITNELKTGFIVSNLCKSICKNTNRPLHILGAGNIYVLPFLINSGASSSDCHSAWRRASDGGYNKAKILIPLFNDKMEFINDHNVLKFVPIKEIDDSYNFDFGMPIELLKKLYQSKGEDFYFAEIYTFYTAMKQYDLIIKYTNEHRDFLNDLCETPDSQFNIHYKKLIKALNL